MHTVPFLSILTALPLAGALIILIAHRDTPTSNHNMRLVALWTTGFNFLLSLGLLLEFDPAQATFQFVEKAPWLGKYADYHLGVDGISLPFVLLTAAIFPLAISAAARSITHRIAPFLIAALILECLLIGTFSALDLVLFYVFFEGSLIPMFFIIGVWGGERRVYASLKFFLFTFLGSVLMLVAMMAMYWRSGTSDIEALLGVTFSPNFQTWAWLAFCASFAVKLPMWPVHTWLPDAHVEAPTAGSVLLAAILLKLGGYGFLRFSLPMFPDASEMFAPYVFVVSVIAILYTSFVALAQTDMKKLIAYSSVAHMGFVTLGLFSGRIEGVEGALVQMVSHGFISAALFLCVGVLYDRTHTRVIASYGGVMSVMPVFAGFFLFFTLANIALPGTSGFVGEFLALVGIFRVDPRIAALAAFGMILSAAYALRLYRDVALGERGPAITKDTTDISLRETLTILPLAAATLYFGLFPAVLLNGAAASLGAVLQRYHGPDVAITVSLPRSLAPESLVRSSTMPSESRAVYLLGSHR